ncbi:SoxY-related AACIE arm protein [Polaromonas sp.]|uniref:SoxY-related AACIE arm protein n=1 Tax=Polaromonas sp. TaxID=1869339 RepID=UPI003BAD4733
MPLMTHTASPTRRQLLGGAAGIAAFVVLRPAGAAVGDLEVAIANYTGHAQVRAGRVKLDIAELVDNGNVVPVTVTAESPMTAADHVKSIAIFNEKNPQRDVARFALGPRSGKASVSTRIRLAATQKLVAIAQMSDGSYWSHTVDVIVTVVACIEGEA